MRARFVPSLLVLIFLTACVAGGVPKAPKLSRQPVTYDIQINVPAYGYIKPAMRKYVWRGFPTTEMGKLCETVIRFGEALEPAMRQAYGPRFANLSIVSGGSSPPDDSLVISPTITKFTHFYPNFSSVRIELVVTITTLQGDRVLWSKDYTVEDTFSHAFGDCSGLSQGDIDAIGDHIVAIMADHAKELTANRQVATTIETIEGGGMQALTAELTQVNASYRVIAASTPVRYAPNADSYKVDTFPLGSVAHVIGTLPTGWMQVAREGKPLGWVHGVSLREERAEGRPAASGAPRFPTKPIGVTFKKASPRPDDVAVIIGNANYRRQGRDIPNVVPAYADAAGMRNYAADALGIDPDNIIFIKDAKQADLIRTFGTETNVKGQVFDWVEPGKSRVFIYYSGHGAPGVRDGTGQRNRRMA